MNPFKLISGYNPGFYADGYIVFVLPFVHSNIRSIVRSSCVKSFCENFSEYSREPSSYLDYRYPIGFAFFP